MEENISEISHRSPLVITGVYDPIKIKKKGLTESHNK